eukprot:9139508-Alexandrium_andersonii.AAC.1
MSASLVGSEMCIRDRRTPPRGTGPGARPLHSLQPKLLRKRWTLRGHGPPPMTTRSAMELSLIHISEPTRLALI